MKKGTGTVHEKTERRQGVARNLFHPDWNDNVKPRSRLTGGGGRIQAPNKKNKI